VHQNSIVHGDLTGVSIFLWSCTFFDAYIRSLQSNILIDDEGKAKLCDFGLSSIVVEFCGTSSLTSCVGGAVRWADALFYSINTDDEETPTPALTTRSDIYSFGSVTLEVCRASMAPLHVCSES
jgi:serine/threonine protein kinase